MMRVPCFAFRVLAFALLVACCAGAKPAHGVTLTAENVEVVAAAKPYGTTRIAIEEMTNALSQAFGRPVRWVARPTPGKVSIVLGMNEWSKAAGIEVAALPRDGFAIRVEGGGRIFIAGRDSPIWNAAAVIRRGGCVPNGEYATLFGVYEFLERYANARFYFPGEFGTLIPRAERLEVPPLNEICAPEYLVRNYYAGHHARWYEGGRPSGWTLNWLRTRMETETIPCCHGSIRFRCSDRFSKTHPEYFALVGGKRLVGEENGPAPSMKDGHLCWSSAVVDEIEKDVLSYLRGEPASVRGVCGWGGGKFAWGKNCSQGRYVDIMPNDSFKKCECEKCKAAWRDDRNYASELIWGVTARIAQKVLDEGLPGCITQMAYYPYARVPEITLPTNVLVMTAVSGPYALGDAKAAASQESRAREWKEKTGRKTWLWTYPRKDEEMDGAPSLCPRAWGRYFKGIAPYAIGAFAESETDRWFFNHLNYYVFGKVCWDSKVDVDALLGEYYRRMFGAAANEMRRIYEEMEDTWLRKVVGRTVETSLGPVVSWPDGHSLWTEIYSPARVKAWMDIADAAERKLDAASGERGRVAFVRRELIEPVYEKTRRYAAECSPAAELARRAEHPEETSIVSFGDFDGRVGGRNCGGSGGWFAGQPPFPIDTNVFVTAGASCRFDATGGASMVLHENLPRLKPSTRYRLSFFLKTDNLRPLAGTGGAHVVVNDSYNSSFPPRRSISGTMDWTHFSFEFTTRPATGSYTRYVRLVVTKSCVGTAWFDGVRISEVGN